MSQGCWETPDGPPGTRVCVGLIKSRFWKLARRQCCVEGGRDRSYIGRERSPHPLCGINLLPSQQAIRDLPWEPESSWRTTVSQSLEVSPASLPKQGSTIPVPVAGSYPALGPEPLLSPLIMSQPWSRILPPAAVLTQNPNQSLVWS